MEHGMNKGKIGLMTMVSVAAVLASSMASADNSPWYVSVSAGSADYGNTVNDAGNALSSGLTSAGVPNTTTSSKTSTGFELEGGYNFNKYFALEGGYFNMGSATIDGTATPPFTGNFHADIKANGWELNAVGTLPINDNWGVFGFGGLIAASVKEDVSANGPGGSAAQSQSASNTTYDVGVGVRYDTGSHWGFRGGFKQFHGMGDSNTTGKGNVNLLFLGASYSF